ncbi:MAG: hypothetical protein PVH30_02995 [Desulfobacterales bacterium]|jgi:hypothetical protein
MPVGEIVGSSRFDMPVVLGTASTVARFGNSASKVAFTMDIPSMV